MIYIDTSVALASIFVEEQQPLKSIWRKQPLSSRLLEYEVWNRVHAYQGGLSHGDHAHELIGRLTIIEMSDKVLSRAFHPFPVPVRTLDGLHLATIDFLRRRGIEIELATYDKRMLAAASAMSIPVVAL